VAGLPWLQPGEISTLEIGEDLVGDAGVNVGFLGHCRSSFLATARTHASGGGAGLASL
jgi:hypothetical protein